MKARRRLRFREACFHYCSGGRRQLPCPVALQRLQAASDGKFIYALGGRTTDVNSSTVATLQRLDPVNDDDCAGLVKHRFSANADRSEWR